MNRRKVKTSSSKRERRSTRSLRNTVLYFLGIVVASLIIAATGIYWANDVFALMKPDKEITVTIPENPSAGQVASSLHASGVINSGLCFRLFAFVAYHGATYRSGIWTLNSGMDYREIMRNVRLTDQSTAQITIPEGYTIDEIVKVLTEKGISSEEELYDVLSNGTFDYDFLPDDLGNDRHRLEGYLFPDTYEFYLKDSAEEIINTLLGNFGNKLNAELKSGETLRELCAQRDMTISEMVNIASMIQKEAASNDEMDTISGVIHNRLNNTMYFPYLNIDAALEYAVGHSPLTTEDLESDSEYNTYNHRGLPPGPICSPGVDAMLAAVTPENHDYFYYVANAKGTAHLFSETLEEQNANIAKVQEEKEKEKEREKEQ